MAVSIGIPIYNAEKFLPDAIRSVFAQTYQDWELILVDDGSTDRSLDIARSVDDPRVRVFSDGLNFRQAKRRNQAVQEAKYDLFAVMDADDLMFPERLETQQALFASEKTQLVSSGVCAISDNDEIKSLRHHNGSYDISPKGLLSYRHYMLHSAVMARTRWFRANPYDVNILHYDDFELFFRCTTAETLTNETVRIMDIPLLFYREDGLQTLKKLRAGEKDIDYAFLKHGHRLNRKTYWKYRLLWKTRMFIYGVACILGVLPRIKQLKDKQIDNEVILLEIKNKLETILRTPVPGMDEYLTSSSYRNR